MRKIAYILVILIFFYPFSTVSMASVLPTMQQVGQGKVYYLKFIKVYDASLYRDKVEDGYDILDSRVSKCLQLVYAVDLKQKDFIRAADEVLANQFQPEELKQVAGDIRTLHGGYENVESGDRYSLCYASDAQTTTLSLNNRELVSITSPRFAEVYFSIWLGKNAPLDKQLRDDLLAADG